MQSTHSKTTQTLNEIFLTPSNVTLEDRFSEKTEAAKCKAGCTGVCGYQHVTDPELLEISY